MSKSRVEEILQYGIDGTPYTQVEEPLKSRVEDLLEQLVTIIQNGGGGECPTPSITIDSALSKTSKNPVQNKVITAALDDKAPIDSPVFTGTPEAPTPTDLTTDTDQIATTAFVQAVVDLLVDGAPENLNTLKELAEALAELDKKAVQSDWDVTSTSSPAYILNKPDLSKLAIPINASTVSGSVLKSESNFGKVWGTAEDEDEPNWRDVDHITTTKNGDRVFNHPENFRNNQNLRVAFINPETVKESGPKEETCLMGGLVLSFAYGNIPAFQLYFSLDTGKFYYRMRKASIDWNEWNEIITSNIYKTNTKDYAGIVAPGKDGEKGQTWTILDNDKNPGWGWPEKLKINDVVTGRPFIGHTLEIEDDYLGRLGIPNTNGYKCFVIRLDSSSPSGKNSSELLLDYNSRDCRIYYRFKINDPENPGNPPIWTYKSLAYDSDIDAAIANLIDGAPDALDTLSELADAIKNNKDIVDALNDAIANKVDKVEGKGLSTNDFTNEYKSGLDAGYLPLSGGTISGGSIYMNGGSIITKSGLISGELVQLTKPLYHAIQLGVSERDFCLFSEIGNVWDFYKPDINSYVLYIQNSIRNGAFYARGEANNPNNSIIGRILEDGTSMEAVLYGNGNIYIRHPTYSGWLFDLLFPGLVPGTARGSNITYQLDVGSVYNMSDTLNDYGKVIGLSGGSLELSTWGHHGYIRPIVCRQTLNNVLQNELYLLNDKGTFSIYSEKSTILYEDPYTTTSRTTIDGRGILISSYIADDDANSNILLTENGMVIGSYEDNRKVSIDDINYYTGQNTFDGTVIYVNSSGMYTYSRSFLTFGAGASICSFSDANKSFSSRSNGIISLGNSYTKWKDVYAVNGTIQTSDRNEKNLFVDLSREKAESLIYNLKPQTYMMNSGTSGRIHWGLISQDIEELLYELGWSSLDFAGFIKSPKMTDGEFNEKTGKYIKEPEIIEGEYNYSLRYDEFIAPIIKVEQSHNERLLSLENKIKEQEGEINTLKEEITDLKNRVKELLELFK